MEFVWQIRLWVLIISILFLACENRQNRPSYKDDFYNHSEHNGFRWLPLVKPFAIKDDGLGWAIKLHYNSKAFLRVDYILVHPDSKIMGYGKHGEIVIGHKDTIPGSFYFFIDLKKQQDNFSVDSLWFKHIMDSCTVSQKDFYNQKDLKNIYSNFVTNGILPWYRE